MKQSYEEGLQAEQTACTYMQQQGMKVITRRFRCRLGEIDLVAQDGPVLVFTEVKYRRSLAHGRPSEAVNAEKVRKLRLCARYYLSRYQLRDPVCRFDVAEIYPCGGTLEVHYVKNAFEGQ